MVRVSAIIEAGGYRESLIAGEDPELALRIRRKGWALMTLENTMTLHDANITSCLQWWRRSMRAGYAYAEGAFLHGSGSERHWVTESRRCTYWTMLPIGFLLVGLLAVGPTAFLVLLVYPLNVLRLLLLNPSDLRMSQRAVWAFFMTVGKFPEFIGLLTFWRNRFVRWRAQLIEYK